MKKNEFWAVYDKKMRVVSISKNKQITQEEALKLSKHRWTYQTFKRDWGYLVSDGYKVLKSKIVPICNCDKTNDEGCNFCS